MSLLDRMRGGTVAAMEESAELDEHRDATIAALEDTNALLTESLLLLEQENRGWLLVEGIHAQREFSRQGLTEIAARARLYWLTNPLIQRAVNVRMFYTWGQGVEISAQDEAVNRVIQDFMDDTLNQQVLFSHDARQDKDRALQLDANVFFALVTSPLTGRVQLRSIPWTEITRIVANPEDRQDRWYYVREWSANTIDPMTGSVSSAEQKAFYPALGYRPRTRVKQFGQVAVNWDSPVVHLRAGGLDGMDFGVSEVYSALGWARAYKGFLEDWASLAKALSKFAWRGKTKTGRTAAMRRAVEGQRPATPTAAALQPAAGQAFVSDGVTDELTPISKTGATLDADSGRPLAMMVAAAMDIPYTILMGDPDIGNLATAKTLDRPTELAMQSRRESWAAIMRQMFDYVVDQAIKAPRGPLAGTVARDENDREVIGLADEGDRAVEIAWPSILEHDVLELVQAIVAADTTGRVPPEFICRWLLLALGAEDVDEIMQDLTDADGNFVDPGLAATVTAGAEAVRQFRAGEDPAGAVA